jgi:hypothetical protein
MVLNALKKRLHDAANSKGGKWIKELPNALWGLRTQPSKPTGQSPYFLVYGSEAILPADVIWDSPAVEHYDEVVSEDSRRVDIDGLEEARCRPRPISKVPGGYPTLPRPQRQGTLLQRWRSRPPSHPEHGGLRKLSSPWEGPFTVAKVTSPGSYRLQTLEGEDVNNSWNVGQLCRFYA